MSGVPRSTRIVEVEEIRSPTVIQENSTRSRLLVACPIVLTPLRNHCLQQLTLTAAILKEIPSRRIHLRQNRTRLRLKLLTYRNHQSLPYFLLQLHRYLHPMILSIHLQLPRQSPLLLRSNNSSPSLNRFHPLGS